MLGVERGKHFHGRPRTTVNIATPLQ